MAMFIRVDVDDAVARKTAWLAKKLVEFCPVNIFAAGADDLSLRVVEDNVDECTRCEPCLEESPTGVKMVKLYES